MMPLYICLQLTFSNLLALKFLREVRDSGAIYKKKNMCLRRTS